jgi:RNA polymerase sigma factor (sigma-70 family)
MQNLIKSCNNGNRFAQRRLYELFAKRMFRLCRRYVNNEQDAEEVLMNGFLKFFSNLSNFQYQGEGSIERWLRQIMVNECLLFLRKNKIQYSSIEIVENQHFELMNCNLELDELYELILTLPLGYRTVFNLYVIEGYNHIEIAKKLDINEGTSKSQLSKAKKMLQTLIEQANSQPFKIKVYERIIQKSRRYRRASTGFRF